MERVIREDENYVLCRSAGVGDTPEAVIYCEWRASRTTSTMRKTTSGVCVCVCVDVFQIDCSGCAAMCFKIIKL